MDSDSQTDKPPQESPQGLTNLLGTAIAFVTLLTPMVSIVFFTFPPTGDETLLTSGDLDKGPSLLTSSSSSERVVFSLRKAENENRRVQHRQQN